MAQWGNTDDAANSVIWAASLVNTPANTTNQTALFANVTTGAFVGGARVGQYGIDVTEAANTSADTSKVAHAGWNLRTDGTGSLVSIEIVDGGADYANTDLIRVSVTGTGTANATGTIVTDGDGAIVEIDITNYGKGFVLVNPTVAVTNSTGGATIAGSGANLIATVGGRAGRTSYETLVAMGSIT